MPASPATSVPDLSTPPITSPTYKLEVAAYPEAKDALSNGLLRLRTDHVSGAKDLATTAVFSLVRIAEIIAERLIEEIKQDEAQAHGGKLHGSPHSAVETWWESCRKAGWILSKYGRPSMNAAITNAIAKLLDRSRLGLARLDEEMVCDRYGACGLKRKVSGADGDGGEQAEAQERCIRMGVERMHAYLMERNEDATRTHIAVALRQFLYEKGTVQDQRRVVKILTLSSSATVVNALATVLETESKESGNRGLNIQLKVMESRPLCEGVDFAKELVHRAGDVGATDRLHIEIASDSSVAILARDVDAVLLGADRISDNGNVSNKTGSLPAVLCAKMLSDKVSVVVVSDLDKISTPGAMETYREEENDVRELECLWDQHPGRTVKPASWRTIVEARNVYFEWVPAKYIDRYICETGILDLNGIREQSEKAQRVERQLFGCFP
ncbi:translation initiation factor eIF-2B subunit family protein [Histoplasma capsulatum var. duboisii H88]|uniref:Translation initiation factor eIF-2B subunit family protein n=1 Tax=Ajellomyces capsulatus (strain H88) TaxID=544711 RepID=F0UPY5_AJEC8|nr:translation initiation factor eIF-2B subunit family protein [Histoplasma capsulatum var. duboisii H88]QSS53208.1 translation initiation factor eIF-2B subunit family protein [Histoplasma capsulatum var. duboisii H88]